MNTKLFFLLLALIYISATRDAFGYIDPGTGLVVTGGLLSVAFVMFSGFLSMILIFMRKSLKRSFRWFWRQKPGLKILLILSVATIPIIYLSTRNKGEDIVEKTKKRTPEIIILGIDGLDYGITKRLMAEKLLPNFMKLAERGTFVPLNPTIPAQSPVVWTSIATGTNPGGHGIFDFIRRDPSNYKLSLAICDSSQNILTPYSYTPVIKGKPFWVDLNEKGLETTIIRWPLTFPAEQLKGNILAGLGVPDITGLLSRYTYYSTDEKDQKKSEEKIILVKKENNIVKTFIKGPLKKGIFETKNINIPMTIEINIDEKSVEIMIDGEKTKVEAKRWSPFLTTGFKTGVTGRLPAIFKVYIESISPDFKMYMTSLQHDPRDTKCGLSFPADFALKLSERTGLFYTLGMPEDTEALEDGAISDEVFLEQCADITEQRKAKFRHAFENAGAGTLAFVFDTSDRIQHMFWRNNVFDEEGNILHVAPEIQRHYIEMDIFLGYILREMGKDANLFVFSDHGFTRFDTQFDTNRWLIENGYMTLKRETSEENSWGALFHLLDWSKTKAYALGFSGIYINKRGREGEGIVTDDEYLKLKQEIRKKLLNTENERGEKIFEKIYISEEIYSGPYVMEAPDLIIGFRPGYGTSRRTAIGGAFEKTIAPNDKKWRGDHIVDSKFVPGVFFSSERMEIERLEATDIAPMIMRAAGKEI